MASSRGPRWRLLAILLLSLLALVLCAPDGLRGPLDSVAHAGGDVDVSAAMGVTAGKLIDSSMHSSTLGMDLPYRIYLPPGYGSGAQRYPVVYLLHGGGAGYEEWTEKSHLGMIVDGAMSQGKIRPMLIVMPEGGHNYWMNHARGGPRWADHTAYDLVSYIDFTYRTIADREHRAIGGLSMGGTGALQLAFNHPEIFSIVAANSPSIRTSMDGVPDFFGDWDYYATYDPLRLARTTSGLRSLQIWLDIGDQDPWVGSALQLHDVLAAREIDHQWHLYPGQHEPSYWMDHTPDYFKFYSDAFAGTRPMPPTATATPVPPTATRVSPTPVPTSTPTPAPTSIDDGAQSSSAFRFGLGFKALADQTPDVVGRPTENEHYGPNGDSLQQTTTGLMVWRKADNWTAFTNGTRTWINGPDGIQERANSDRFDWEKGGPTSTS